MIRGALLAACLGLLTGCVAERDISRDAWEAERRMPSEPVPHVGLHGPAATPLDVEGLH